MLKVPIKINWQLVELQTVSVRKLEVAIKVAAFQLISNQVKSIKSWMPSA
jgi:hypothetical protein